mgnify:CR=1 FL=1
MNVIGYLNENLLWLYCTTRVVCKDACFLNKADILRGCLSLGTNAFDFGAAERQRVSLENRMTV